MKVIEGGVTAPKGFQAAGIFAGIKKDKKDMAMVYSEVPCVVAGTFTTNVVKAAPVKWDQHVVYEVGKAGAIVANSGIANACTGEEGYGYCRETAAKTAELLHISEDQILVASTGVIGRQLPMDKIKGGVEKMIPLLSDTKAAGTLAAESIMTTDTIKKETAIEFTLGGKTVTIGAMSKGSGMIHPNMGTMLCFLTTDCAISPDVLQDALYEVTKVTFNRVSVDGDTSTNDTCCILASGAAENQLIDWKSEDYDVFYGALKFVCTELAKKIAGDGEGATKLVTCTVSGSRSDEAAEKLAMEVIRSSLVKAAMFGADANWGRVLCAMGYSKAPFRPECVDVSFASAAGSIAVCKAGEGMEFDEELAKKVLSQDEVEIQVNVNEGEHAVTAWGCDLTYDYVKINGDYRT